MKDKILKLAKMKDEKSFYKAFPTEESFMAKYGKQIKKLFDGDELLKPMQSIGMKQLPTQGLDTKTLDPMNQQSGDFDLGSMFNPGMEIGKGIVNIIEEGKKRRKAEQWANVSDVVRQASSLQPEQQQRQYVRPEDIENTGEEYFPIYGVGTNVLAKNGKQLKKAEGGMGIENLLSMAGNPITKGTDALFQDNAGYELGKSVGSAVKMIPGVGPIVGAIAEPVLGTIGGLLDPNQKKIRKANERTQRNMGLIGMQNDFGGVQQQYSSFMRTGGNIRQNTMDGDLQVYDGEAEQISYNPYSESETVMFRGPSHEDGGMPITYGNSPVEVEGGEPAVKMNDGGNAESLVVFGNLQIPKNMLQDKNANGKKFKNYIADLSKVESKQNKIMENSTKLLDETSDNTSFDKLKLTSLKANMLGANMKLKELAEKKQDAASLQNAINETAEEHGIVADDLARGKIKKAKNGLKMALNGVDEIKEYSSEKIKEIQRSLVDSGFGDIVGRVDGIYGPKTQAALEARDKKFAPLPQIQEDVVTFDEQLSPVNLGEDYQISPILEQSKQKKNNFPWEKAINSVLPYLRPSDAESLDPRQLAGEMYSLSNNQLEPVYAQTLQPELSTPYNISYQDVLNENQADFRSTQRMVGNNPAALAMLNAQKYGANQKVLGEQFRQNQQEQSRVFEKNRDILNKTKITNIDILDQQQDRQSKAKSKTKEQYQKALSSIADKLATDTMERQFAKIEENRYNYRFDEQGRAITMNPLYQWNTQGNNTGMNNIIESGGKQYRPVDYDNKTGQPIKFELIEDKTSKTKKRNGAIVRALKNY